MSHECPMKPNYPTPKFPTNCPASTPPQGHTPLFSKGVPYSYTCTCTYYSGRRLVIFVILCECNMRLTIRTASLLILFLLLEACVVVDVMNGDSTEDFILERNNAFMITPNLPEICLQQPRELPPPPPSLRVDVCDLAAASLLT
jgi:hypothetical protein